MKEHHKRETRFLMLFLILFCIFFSIAFLGLQRDFAVIGILPAKIEDWFIMIFSLLAIIKVFWHLIK